MTFEEYQKVREVLREVSAKITTEAKELDDKGRVLGEGYFETKMMYFNQSIGLNEANMIIFNKLQELNRGMYG